jgi:hypothetical protein
MTRDEFDAQKSRPCSFCGNPVALAHNPNNNSIQVVCTHRGAAVAKECARWRTPWGGLVIHIKQNNKTRRKEYPDGESLDEVWERFGNVCVVCSAPKDALMRLGIGRQRQHVLPYAQHGHQGPLVPMCVPCHENATSRQKLFWFWYRRESISCSSTRVSETGLSPDSVRPERQAPIGALEGLSDHDAHH